MSRPSTLRVWPFVLAVAVAAALVLSAPFIGFVRSWMRAQFPGQFVPIVGGIIAVMAVAALGSAVLRIRERRAIRYAALAAALAVAVWYSLAEATGNPDVDVVQRFHFVEYGLITYLFYRAWRPLDDAAVFVLPALAGLLVSTADEWLQWFIPNRVGEIADIFLNGVAIGCGLLFSFGADPPEGAVARLHRGSWARIGRLAAAVVLAVALFFQIVHLGYDIHDQEIGMFKSRYSPSRLPQLEQEKQAEWRTHPLPLVLRRVSREDQYMTEGVTHVQRRNEQLAANDAASAWRENQILETYYAPVLDTPSYVSRTGHRWPPEQRSEVAARAAGGAAGYVSTANPYPIYPWSQVWFWGAAVALAAFVWIACRRLDARATGAPMPV